MIPIENAHPDIKDAYIRCLMVQASYKYMAKKGTHNTACTYVKDVIERDNKIRENRKRIRLV